MHAIGTYQRVKCILLETALFNSSCFSSQTFRITGNPYAKIKAMNLSRTDAFFFGEKTLVF